VGVIYPVYIGRSKCPMCGGDMLTEIQLYMPCDLDTIQREKWTIHLRCLDCGYSLNATNIYNVEKAIRRALDEEDSVGILRYIREKPIYSHIDPIYYYITLLMSRQKKMQTIESSKYIDPYEIDAHYRQLLDEAMKKLPEDRIEELLDLISKVYRNKIHISV